MPWGLNGRAGRALETENPSCTKLSSVSSKLLNLAYCIRLCGNRVELREKLPNQLKYNYVTYV